MVISLACFIFLYVSIGLLVILGLWVFSEWRYLVLYKKKRQGIIFHCIKCGKIYIEKDNREQVPCPCCHFNNITLRF